MRKRFEFVLLSVIMLINCMAPAQYAYATETDEVLVNDVAIEEISDKDDEDTIYLEYKLGLERLEEEFPTEFVLAINGIENNVRVMSWECQEDYDQKLGEYHFKPVLEDEKLTSEVLELPVITVIVDNEDEGVVGGYIEVEENIETLFNDSVDNDISVCDIYSEEIANVGETLSQLPRYFNGYEEGYLPEIRNQGTEGACWAFASIGAIETELILNGLADTNVDLSELHLAYYATHYYPDPENCRTGDYLLYEGSSYLSFGGNSVSAARVLANRFGAVEEQYAPYRKGSGYAIPNEYAMAVNKVQLKETGRISADDRDNIKKAILQYGSVSASFKAKTGSYSVTTNGVTKRANVRYSATYNSFYGEVPSTDHGVMLVGWDDDFSKDNFYDGCKPEGDGAWLVRNSWGLDDYGQNGYFWLSYYDKGLLAGKEVLFFEADEGLYDHVYAYDYVSNSDNAWGVSNGATIKQTFSVNAGQSLEAIAYEIVSANTRADIEISYKNQKVQQTAIKEYKGYHTVQLAEPIYIDEAGTVTVAISYTALDDNHVYIPYAKNGEEKRTNTGNGTLTINHVSEADDTVIIYGNQALNIEGDARIKLLANDAEPKDIKLSLKNGNIYDYCETTHQLEVVSEDVDEMPTAELTWYSEDEDIATVDENGLVTVGYKKGSTVVVGTFIDCEGVAEKVYCNVRVKPYVISYELGDDVIVGKLTKEYYPEDISNCSLSGSVYKEGYNFVNWYSDSALSQSMTSYNLSKMRGDITLYPEWYGRNLYIYYYGLDENGEYTEDDIYRFTFINAIDMPCDISAAKVYADPNELIETYNEINDTCLEFDYWSWDKEGLKRIDTIDCSSFNLRANGYSNGPTYTQSNNIYIYPQFRVTKDECAKLNSASLHLNGRIGINYYIALPQRAAYVELSNKHGRIEKYNVSDIYRVGSQYCFSFDLAVKELNDEVAIRVYDDQENIIGIECGDSIVRTFYYSAGDYINKIIDENNDYNISNKKLFNLCKALGEYSATVKNYLQYDSENQEGLEECSEAFKGIDLTDEAPELEWNDDELKYIGTSLLLANNTTIRHYFYMNSENCNIQDYEFVINDGEIEKVIYPKLANGYYYIDITGIAAPQLDEKLVLNVRNNNSQEESTIEYSALSYVYKVSSNQSTDGKLKRLCENLYWYNKYANEYWDDIKDYYEQSIVAVKLNKVSLGMSLGEVAQLDVTCLPLDSSEKKAEWSSSNSQVVSVDSEGQLLAKSEGIALIKVKVDEAWAQCLVQVGDAGRPEIGDNCYILDSAYFEQFDSPTVAINDAIDALTDECNTLYIPAGDYWVNACDGIHLKSNINIIMDDNAVLHVKPNEASHYDVIIGENIENVNICGGNIAGERLYHKNYEGEWGMGIGLYRCKNVSIFDMDIYDCWGDGIYLGTSDSQRDNKCQNIQVINCNLRNNRRNNMSIVAADNVIIEGCTFDNANGTDPQYGLDIETNYESIPCTNIAIYNSSFSGNNNGSFLVATSANNIDIVGCTFNDGLFVNLAGKDAGISNSQVNGTPYLKYGMIVGEGLHINDGTEEEDTLVAYYNADMGASSWKSWQVNAGNPMTCEQIVGTDNGGRKVLRLKRTDNGNGECGYYINASDIGLTEDLTLEQGVDYRFEYVVKGTGYWGVKPGNSDWYPCMPVEKYYATCITTQTIQNALDQNFIIYACDRNKDMYIDIESLKIYRIN